MTTQRKAKKRARKARNAIRRLVATPDDQLTPERLVVKNLHLAIEHAIFFGASSPCPSTFSRVSNASRPS